MSGGERHIRGGVTVAAGGVLPFTIAHPRKGSTVTVYLAGETPYRIAAFSPDAWSVSFSALVRE